MKNAAKSLGIIALAAVIGFSMAACGGNDDGGGSSYGNEMKLSGDVYTESFDWTTFKVSYTKYSGDSMTVSVDGITGDGSISGSGSFAYTIGIPKSEELYLASEFFNGEDGEDGEDYTNISVTPADAKCFVISNFEVDSNNYYWLSRQNSSMSVSSTSMNFTMEFVYYVYVDKDVAFKGTGTRDSWTDEDGDSYEYKTENFNLSFKQGWNAVHTKYTQTETAAGGSETEKISLGSPGSLKWVLQGDDDDWGEWSVKGPRPMIRRMKQN